MAAPVDPATRKKVLKVVFFSLLLDLVRPPSPSSVYNLLLGSADLLTQMYAPIIAHNYPS
jgi:hypothetical protein